MRNLDNFLEKRKSEVPARIEQFINNQVKQVNMSIEQIQKKEREKNAVKKIEQDLVDQPINNYKNKVSLQNHPSHFSPSNQQNSIFTPTPTKTKSKFLPLSLRQSRGASTINPRTHRVDSASSDVRIKYNGGSRLSSATSRFNRVDKYNKRNSPLRKVPLVGESVFTQNYHAQPTKFHRETFGLDQHRITPFIENDSLVSIRGPFLFTAPHGCALKQERGYFKTQRNHKIELYTSTIVTSLCHEIDKLLKKPQCSFVVWAPNNIKKMKPQDLDPNYLNDDELEFSPFHQAIHKFVIKNLKDQSKARNMMSSPKDKNEFFDSSEVVPMLHIDIHGKMGSHHWKNDDVAHNLDFATMSMKHYMHPNDQNTFVNPIIDSVQDNFNAIYKDVKIGMNQI